MDGLLDGAGEREHDGSPGARASARRLEVPIALLRYTGADLAAAAEPVRRARRPAAVLDAGPASEVVADLLAEVDGALAGLEARLAATAEAIRRTADDFSDTDRQVALRLLAGGVDDLFVGPGGP